MKKNVEKILKGLAKQLPASGYSVKGTAKIMGADIELTGLEVPEEMKIESDKEYQFSSPVYIQSNHTRRIKRAFKSNGIDGVIKYVLKFIQSEHHKRVETNIKEVLTAVA